MTIANVKNWAIYSLLILLTLSAPLGHFFRCPTLLKIGLASLSSPLMIVYSELSGDRVMSYKYELTLTDTNNSVKNIILDKQRYNKISSHENPFNRHLLILTYMEGTFLLTGEGKSTIDREKVLRYGICNNGPYAKYLDLDSEIKELTIRIYKNMNSEDIVNEYKLIC